MQRNILKIISFVVFAFVLSAQLDVCAAPGELPAVPYMDPGELPTIDTAGRRSSSPSINSLMEKAAVEGGYEAVGNPMDAFSVSAGKFIQVFLSLLGVIFVILAVYSGYLWMTARGNEESVTKAKDILQNAIIGLVVVVSAYAVTYFILYYFAKGYLQGGGNI